VSLKLHLFLVSALLPVLAFGQDVGLESEAGFGQVDVDGLFGQKTFLERSGKSLLSTFPFNAGNEHDHAGGHHDDHANHAHHEHDDQDDGRYVNISKC